MIRQCEWIRKLPNDQITFCTPKVLKEYAQSISSVCKKEMLLTTIKTHFLTTSIFTFILGMMISVIPVGFTALVVPAFYALMATSLISLVGYLYVSTIVEKIVDYKNASIIKTNLVCLSKLFPEE